MDCQPDNKRGHKQDQSVSSPTLLDQSSRPSSPRRTPNEIDLATLLKQETEAIRTMLELSCQLQASLVRFDTSAFERLAREQESTLQQLQHYEQQRWEHIATRFGLAIEQVRSLALSELLQLLPSDERNKLQDCADQLRDYLAQLQLANSINRMLALRGRNSIHATLAFVKERNLHAVNTAL
jgi:flagellar biosynthesis/type III secretory pathway chaperone